MVDALVTTQWLADHLNDADVKVLDATYFLPNEAQNAREHFLSKHIPHARFFDIDACCDKTHPAPHMLPSAEEFSAYMSALGISNDDTVIIYDAKGLFSAARLWWMLRGFGHNSARVAVLDGGLLKWEAEARSVVSGESEGAFSSYQCAEFNPHDVCDVDYVLSVVEDTSCVIVDARSQARFLGTAPEPRAGVRSGHIPTSINIPYQNLLEAPYNTMASPEKLRDIFYAAGEKPVIVTCGSGVTACVLALALHLIQRDDVRVYDGSWSQWGALDYTPIV